MADSSKSAPAGRPKQSTLSTKTADAGRRQTASPVDQQSRKQSQPPARAWQGPNPITSRGSNNTSPLANGAERSQRPTARASADTHADKHAHDRLLFLLANMTGCDATLTLKNGEQFTGILAGGTFESAAKSFYTLKMVKRTKLPAQQQANGSADLPDEYAGEGDDHVASFDVQDTVNLTVNDVQISSKSAQSGSATSSFRTDTEISGRAPGAPRERELQRWQPGASDMSLDDMALEGGATGWDQFAVNEQKYGVQTTYDENIYTTSIDTSHPQYKQRMAKAERLAQEIEGSAPANQHVAEERLRDMLGVEDGDEEEKYSGVQREVAALPKASSGSYVPPSRRPITSQPTVPGAPFDPAIISSQVARPTNSVADKPVERSETTTPVEKVPSPIPVAKNTPGTTEDRVRDTADAFKQFANNEKLRLRQAQELKRTNARNEKNVRINDLKKFAENFKLKSRVPDDLVPILAKDHDKQLEIKRKAEEAARLEEQRGKEAPKAASPTDPAGAQNGAAERASATTAATRPRVTQTSRSQYVPQPHAGMSQRQASVFNTKPLPRQNVTIPTGPSAQLNPASPATAGKLNVNAKAFEFRPAASNFTPSGTTPSPQRVPSIVQPSAPVSFFDEKEKAAIAARTANDEHDTDMIAYLIQDAASSTALTAEQKKPLAATGGVPHPYRTAPTWTVAEGRENSSYEDMFPKPQTHGRSPMHTPNGQMPQQFAPPQARYPFPGYGVPGFTPYNPQMGVPGASVQSSPRGQAAHPYGGPMGQMPMAHMGQFPGQPMPMYSTSPNMGNRMLGPGPVMIQPGYGQGNAFRQSYSGGQLPGMMPQGPGFMPHQGFSPMPQNIQPHMPHFSGSPRAGPPMMQQGNSYQGFQPGMPQYGQQSPYAMNQRQHSAGHFPQATPRQAQAIPAQPLPSPGVNGQADDNK